MALTGRIRPPAAGITPEAAEALGMDNPEDLPELDEASLNAEPGDVEAEPEPPLFTETGDYIDEPRLRQKALPTPPPRDASKGIPQLDEWLDFFSRIFLRVICDWYISFAFRGIDGEVLSDREVDRLQLSAEERKRIAVPLSELSYKSKLMRRHGRTIIASGGAFDALITIGMWASRVNRIASKHRPKVAQGKVYPHGSSGSATPANGAAAGAEGANGGRVAGEWTIYNPGG
jgi:hypothetical protein